MAAGGPNGTGASATLSAPSSRSLSFFFHVHLESQSGPFPTTSLLLGIPYGHRLDAAGTFVWCCCTFRDIHVSAVACAEYDMLQHRSMCVKPLPMPCSINYWRCEVRLAFCKDKGRGGEQGTEGPWATAFANAMSGSPDIYCATQAPEDDWCPLFPIPSHTPCFHLSVDSSVVTRDCDCSLISL